MPDDLLHRQIAAAEPRDDALDRQWVRARAAKALFTEAADKPPVVGRYELGDKLGVGGMGVVYAARDPELDRDVAIKLIRVNDSDDRDQTHAEAQALARVTHPNVVAIHDVGIVDDQVYIVMEYVRGQTLRAYARDDGRTQRELVDVYRQATEGLAAAHREGLIHRDFKPDNAIIGEDGRVRVIDFGLAHEHETESANPTAGTPRYMAPEQARGEPLTAAVDQFAVCASLEESLKEAVDDKLAPWLATLVARGQEEAPDERFADLTGLLSALDSDPTRLLRRRVLGGALAIAIVAAFVGGAMAFRGEGGEPTCEGAGDEIELAWSTVDRRAALEHIAAQGDYGASLAPRLSAGVGSFIQKWTHGHRRACLAHERGEQSSDLLDQRMACLARQKRALAKFGELSRDASGETLASLAPAVVSLPDPTACANIETLTDKDAPPATIAGDVAALEGALSAAEVVLAAGRFEEATKTTTRLLDDARRLKHRPTLARTLLLRGRCELATQRYTEAIPLFFEATQSALGAGLDHVAIEAWARRAWIEGNLGKADEALEGLELIEGLTERLGEDAFASGLLYTNLGSVEIARGNKVAAREHLERAVEISRGVKGKGALELINSRSNLAIVTETDAERDALAAESVDLLTKALGAEHPQTLAAILNRALLATDSARGVDLLAKSCGLLRSLHPGLRSAIADCFAELGWFAEQRGDSEGAASAMRTVAANGDGENKWRALAWLGDKDASEALGARVSKEPSAEDPWWMHFRWAEAAMVLGRTKSDRALSEKAVATLEAIEDPLPIVLRRLAVARLWIASD